LAAGNYGWQAVFTSNSLNYKSSPTGVCEPFTVSPAPTATTTTVHDAAGGTWTNTETTGAQAFDTAQVSLVSGNFPFPPTQHVTFTLFSSPTALSSDAACTGTAGPGDVETISATGTATSQTTVPLVAGFYGYQATYSGDSNYATSTGNCEPFSVGKPATATNTTVLSGDQQPAPASTQDSATITLAAGGSFPATIPPTGTVTFTLFSGTGAFATGSPCDSQEGSLALGSSHDAQVSVAGTATSPVVSGLTAGFYGWQASYSKDPNYAGSPGNCEPFHVLVPPTVSAVKTEPTPGNGVTVNPFDPTLSTIAYSITLTNSGQIGATGVTLSDQIPTGLAGVANISDGGSSNGTTITWTGLAIPAGGTKTVTFTGTVSSSDLNGAVITNQAAFTVPQGDLVQSGGGPGASCSGNTCRTNTVSNPVAYPIIGVVKSSVPTSGSIVGLGDTIIYTLTLSNAGLLDAPNVTITDMVPTGTDFVSASPSVTPNASGLLTWSGLTVPAAVDGTSGTTAVHFTVTVSAGDTNGEVIPNHAVFTNVHTPGTGCVTSNDTTEGTCDTNTVTQTVEFPILTAVKSSSPADGSNVVRGETITYSIKLSNSGMLDATNVTVTDDVPTGTTYVAGSASNGGSLSGSAITWSGLTVPAGGSATLTFKVTVDSTDTSGEVIPNHALFTDVHTPGCSTATCDTNTVKVTVVVPTVVTVPLVVTTTTTKAPVKGKLAFTGADTMKFIDGGLVALGIGGLLVLSSRRRRQGRP
jgi:uncharacterized repeat protein (TIGR01451 family)